MFKVCIQLSNRRTCSTQILVHHGPVKVIMILNILLKLIILYKYRHLTLFLFKMFSTIFRFNWIFILLTVEKFGNGHLSYKLNLFKCRTNLMARCMNRALGYQQRFKFLQMLIEQSDMEYQLGHTVRHTT